VETLFRWLFGWRHDPVTTVIIGLLGSVLGIYMLEGKHDARGWAWLGGAIVFLIIGIATRINRGTWKPRLREENDSRGTGVDR
jgi:hypothetical protein